MQEPERSLSGSKSYSVNIYDGQMQCRDFTSGVNEVLTAASVHLLSADQLEAVLIMGGSQYGAVVIMGSSQCAAVRM